MTRQKFQNYNHFINDANRIMTRNDVTITYNHNQPITF